jgi:cell division septation protein DedD
MARLTLSCRLRGDRLAAQCMSYCADGSEQRAVTVENGHASNKRAQQKGQSMSGNPFSRRTGIGIVVVAASLLATGCDENGKFSFAGTRAGDEAGADSAPQASRSVQLVERDVEAPGVFQVTGPGLWDGRPSLGGVWVAHPDVTDPERVIIRNQTNGKFVIGALFRRERENPGPELQVSSDAAVALEMLAGAPAELNVTALRREEVQQPDAPAPAATTDFDAPAEIETTTLDPIAGAAAAIQAAEAAVNAGAAAGTPTASPAPVAAPSASTSAATTPSAPVSSSLSKPYVQLGIFSVEANANATADQMRAAGVVPTVLQQESQGRTFWRVIIGPANTEAERAQLLAKVKAQGFTDAYFVAN